MSKSGWMLVAAFMVSALGCATTQPIYNVVNAPVVIPSGKAASLADVQRAILLGGAKRGWSFTEQRPGLMTGRFGARGHVAVIDVEFSAKSYSLKYKESVDLGEKDGQIHRNYNSWIQNLNTEIQAQLAKL